MLLRVTLVAAAATLTSALRPAIVPGTLPARRVRALTMAEDEFNFGDAADFGTLPSETVTSVMAEERELTEKEKEIARLRAAEVFMQKSTGDAACTTCAYVYKMADGINERAFKVQRNTPFELLPENFACPTCGSPKPFFKEVTIEIAGFEENQNYGFGNSMTEAGKSNLIFGGLAAFFVLFMGGYALN